jgi:hypothetical protein
LKPTPRSHPLPIEIGRPVDVLQPKCSLFASSARTGATIDEIIKKFEWQPHTVRAAIVERLKKKLGLDVHFEKVDGRGRVYRIAN